MRFASTYPTSFYRALCAVCSPLLYATHRPSLSLLVIITMMPTTRSAYLVLIVITALLGTGYIWLTRPDPTTANPPGLTPAPRPGYVAPDFTLTTLSGDDLTLSDLRGQAVVLNFWASWCGPCRAEMPAFEAAYLANRDTTIFVGVNVGEDATTAGSYVAEVGVTYPIPLDPNADIARLYRINGFPTTFFIDEFGVIHDMTVGGLNLPALQAELTAFFNR